MAVTYEAFRQAEPPTRAVRAARTVDRWGLVAGVTGVLGNVLLAVLFTTPAGGPHAWTGPASDVPLISGPVYAAFPIWLIVLSDRVPGHAGSPGQLV